MNMARAELLGWGAQVTYQNLTSASLSWALNEVLNNGKYNENVRVIARRLSDQPQTPMEKAIFWIEYVIRHNGAHYMQTSAQHLSFIEVNNLDVYAAFAIITFLVIFIPVFIIRRIAKFLRSFGKSSKTNPTRKKN